MAAATLAATIAVSSAGAATRDSDAAATSIPLGSLEARCPRAVADQERLGKLFLARRPAVGAPTDAAIRIELLRMSRSDQKARRSLIEHGITNAKYELVVKRVDAENLRRLKRIFEKRGLPTPAMVGYDGMDAAWLLLQHADADPAWQRQWLGAIEQLAKQHELSPQSYALFVDRVLVDQGRRQIYGSQFQEVDGRHVLQPTVDPDNLDERRKAIGLIPESEYECILDAMYGSGNSGER
jgi:hypothetical protein